MAVAAPAVPTQLAIDKIEVEILQIPILGITPLNVRVRLNRAKDKLKYIIKTMGYEF